MSCQPLGGLVGPTLGRGPGYSMPGPYWEKVLGSEAQRNGNPGYECCRLHDQQAAHQGLRAIAL